ncbi:MAG: Uma2 family endonuclease [Pirellulaceae bacterium]|nr:Uma2 family endonuclease [Planctomycetales bacterium]
MSISSANKEVFYPESDGQPMAENTLQFEWITMLKGNLDAVFARDPQVFVAGDLFWYPVEGNNKIRSAPDTMVVFGRPKGHRSSYLQWREDNIAPQVVFEVLSPGNSSSEMDRRWQFFQNYGVEEYYLVDPDNFSVKGWLRRDGELQPIEAAHTWTSPRLGIRFAVDKDSVQVFRPDGVRFATFLEMYEQGQTEAQRADTEAQRAEAAARRVAALESRLRSLGYDVEQSED